VPEHLVPEWAGAELVALRTLQAAFTRELTPAERVAWTDGEHTRRGLDLYLQLRYYSVAPGTYVPDNRHADALNTEEVGGTS
jgi:hypothetical protein